MMIVFTAPDFFQLSSINPETLINTSKKKSLNGCEWLKDRGVACFIELYFNLHSDTVKSLYCGNTIE